MISAAYLRLGILMLGLVVEASVVNAQTRFRWPSTAVDVAAYTTVEECLAATERVADSVGKRERIVVWADTMPFDPKRVLRPLPARVVETASRCSARFAEPRTPLEDFDLFVKLYLQANRDADASAVVTRRLSTAATQKERDSALKLYLTAQPLRVAEVERMLEQQIGLTRDPLERLRLYMSVAEIGQRAGDTALVRRIAQGIIAQADSLPAPIRQRLDSGFTVVIAAQAFLAKEALLDSLRRGTPQYVALLRSFLTRLWGTQQAPSLLEPIGDRAAPIAGEFWFRREPANVPRPTPGRVSLIVFFRGGCQEAISSLERKWTNDDSCWGEAATLRRLAKRFPALDVTLVENTRGYFTSAALDTPAAEAEWFRRWADAHRLPGAISVSVTPFRRLPDPDRRRVDELVSNVKNYPRATGVGAPLAFLVDRNGVIVHQNVFGSPGGLEDQPGIFGLRWVDLIEILLRRDEARASGH